MQPQQQQSQPNSSAPYYPMQNAQPKQIEVEFGKHVLNVDPLELILYKSLAGWRTVYDEEESGIWGRSKRETIESIEVDYDGRMMNEKGANYVLQTIQALVIPVSTTSKLTPMTIYRSWKTLLMTTRIGFLDSYYFPKLRCNDCNYNTSKFTQMHYHIKNMGHTGYRRIINPYEVDIDRLLEIQIRICNLHVITSKSDDGFMAKEIFENYNNSNQQGGMSIPLIPQQRSIGDVLLGRNKGV